MRFCLRDFLGEKNGETLGCGICDPEHLGPNFNFNSAAALKVEQARQKKADKRKSASDKSASPKKRGRPAGK